jgi:hypothetical protein
MLHLIVAGGVAPNFIQLFFSRPRTGLSLIKFESRTEFKLNVLNLK